MGLQIIRCGKEGADKVFGHPMNVVCFLKAMLFWPHLPSPQFDLRISYQTQGDPKILENTNGSGKDIKY